MSKVRVLVGTRKGAFILNSDGKRDKWEVNGLEGFEFDNFVVTPPRDQWDADSDQAAERYDAEHGGPN